MALEFELPIGHPGLVTDQTDADAFRSELPHSGLPFGGDQVQAIYHSQTNALPDDYRPLVAMTTGMAHFDPVSRMIRLEFMYSTRQALKEIFGDALPVPTRVVMGPLQPGFNGLSCAFQAGEVMGSLIGEVFMVNLQDQNRFYMNPLDVFHAFGSKSLWHLPSGVGCPLIPNGYGGSPFQVAGPQPVAFHMPYLKVSGGSLALAIHNPPDPLPSNYFSFLSSDPIHLEVVNPPPGSSAKIRLTDSSHAMYRTQHNPAFVDTAVGQNWDLVTQDVLKPHHLSYQTPTVVDNVETDPGNGKTEPGKPLTYQLRLAITNPNLAFTTTLTQDEKDIIRQEFLFHSPPFQATGPVLVIPSRKEIQRNYRPVFADHFNQGDLQKSNYDAENGNWMLNVDEVYLVAEWMRRALAGRLAARRTAGTLPGKINSYGVNVNSSWRNPERNERKRGQRNSDHQFGRALDLCPSQAFDGATVLDERKLLLTELFKAGREFLEALVSINTASRCSKVQILLEKRDKLLWSFGIKNGAIESKAGSGYPAVVGSAPPADSEQAILLAAGKASHVHVGWKPDNLANPLTLPNVNSYDSIAPSLAQPFRTVIAIASEDTSVSAGSRLPLNHIAASLKLYLEAQDPGVPVDILEVGNALQYLNAINAFRPPAYKIKYFFSFSHAWPAGLVLTHFNEGLTGVPYQRAAGVSGPQIHDEDLFNDINFAYGSLAAPGDSDLDADQTLAQPIFTAGTDDYSQIKTHQIRVSNLIYLPSDAIQNLRITLKDCEGIFVVGCRSAEEPDSPNLDSFAQAFANVSRKTVYGAAYYSKVFQRDDAGDWEGVDLTRGDPPPSPNNPVVLVPGALGGLQFIRYVAPTALFGLGRDIPTIGTFPEEYNLVNLYKAMLVPCHPEEE